jgi:hypothetical protein
LERIETILVTGNIGLDIEDGHDIAYQRILSACALYENPPRFFSSDSTDFGGLDIADKVLVWMNRCWKMGMMQVLEDGNDAGNSESDSENEDHGEVLTGMYTPEIKLGDDGRPVNSGLYRLSADQASALRARATRCAEESRGPPHRRDRG